MTWQSGPGVECVGFDSVGEDDTGFSKHEDFSKGPLSPYVLPGFVFCCSFSNWEVIQSRGLEDASGRFNPLRKLLSASVRLRWGNSESSSTPWCSREMRSWRPPTRVAHGRHQPWPGGQPRGGVPGYDTCLYG